MSTIMRRHDEPVITHMDYFRSCKDAYIIWSSLQEYIGVLDEKKYNLQMYIFF